MSDMVSDPVRRQRYRFSRDGDSLLATVETDPGGDVPEHVHPAQTEWWDVLEGDVLFRIDGQPYRATAGDRVRADAGVRHAFVNDGGTVAILRVRVSPAGELQAFLTEAARLATAGKFNARGIPSSPASAVTLLRLAVRYRNDIQITAPPLARIINAVLRALPARPSTAPSTSGTPRDRTGSSAPTWPDPAPSADTGSGPVRRTATGALDSA